MTFEQFQQTRTWCDDIGAVLSDEILTGRPGQMYLGSLYIESALDIEGATGEYLLTLYRDQRFGDLETLERALYEFAESEGYLEDYPAPADPQ